MGTGASTSWPPGDGEMARLIRDTDWAGTPLGDKAGWPQSLRTAVDACLVSGVASFIWWGRDLIQLYNHPAQSLLRGVHPDPFAAPAAKAWRHVWQHLAPMLAEAKHRPAAVDDIALTGEPDRRFRLTCGPIYGEVGGVAGHFLTAVETRGAAQAPASPDEAAAALRVSEERFSRFADASSDLLCIRSAETLQWEFLSPTFETIHGVSRAEAFGEDGWRNWTELIVPADRAKAIERVERARQGEPVSFEYRISRPDGQIRWLRNADFPLRDQKGKVRWIGGIVRDLTPEKMQIDRARILLSELQHRVRNTLSVIRSIARRTAETTENVQDYAMHLEGRIDAFARIQASVTRDPASGIDLTALIADELHAAGAREDEQIEISGPPVAFRSKPAELMALAIHELVTNAIKHGALTAPSGRIDIAWTVDDGRTPVVTLVWKESGVADAPLLASRQGFGTVLLEQTLAYELRAEVEQVFEPDGLRCTISIPLTNRIVTT